MSDNLDRSLDPRCPECGHALRLRYDDDDRRITCPVCGAALTGRVTEFEVNGEPQVSFDVERAE
jgi:uncharacterized Zn finger protein (UPF0148 family)